MPFRLVRFLYAPFHDPAHDWQLALLDRFLSISVTLTTLFLILDASTGQDIAVSVGAVSVTCLGKAVLHWHPHWARWLVAALFVSIVLLLGLVAVDTRSAVPSAFCMAMLPGMMGTMMQGPAFGSAIAGLMLAIMAASAWAFPLASRLDAYRFTNELAMLFFGLAMAWALDRTFRRYQTALLKRTEQLQRARAAGGAMAEALFSRVAAPLSALRQALDDPAQSPAQAQPLVAALLEQVNQARSLYTFTDAPPPAPVDDHRERRRHLALAAVAIVFCLQCLLLLRNATWGGPVGANLVAIITLPLLYAGLRRWPQAFSPGRVGVALLLSGLILSARVSQSWGMGTHSPNLVLLPSLVLLASLLNGRAVQGLAFVASLGLLAWAAQGPALPTMEARLLIDLALMQLVLAMVGISVVQMRQAFLAQARGQAEALTDSLRLRQHLAGTLFHDVNNQLMALTTALALAPEGGAQEAKARAAQLCERIDGLVRVSKGFLLSDAPAELRPLAVPDLFRDKEQLFRARLQAKSQRLFFIADGGLSVLGLPEIVTESVLGNLVSNAIKFSPAGAIIDVEAVRSDGGVALRVRDCGPGIPDALLLRLQDDSPLPSAPGSAGEPGHGYGLKLAREHLQRLGGRLELKRHPQGGTLAVAWLRAA